MFKMFFKGSVAPESGLTLVETLVSMLIFLAVIGGLLPVYMTYRLQTLQTPVRNGAVAVSQQIMDEVRRVRDVELLPGSGQQTQTPQGRSLTNLSAYGKTYRAQLHYCDRPNFCDENSRQIRVSVFQVFSNGTASSTPVYEVSSIYTKFEAQ